MFLKNKKNLIAAKSALFKGRQLEAAAVRVIRSLGSQFHSPEKSRFARPGTLELLIHPVQVVKLSLVQRLLDSTPSKSESRSLIKATPSRFSREGGREWLDSVSGQRVNRSREIRFPPLATGAENRAGKPMESVARCEASDERVLWRAEGSGGQK